MNNFYVFVTIIQDTTVHFMTGSLTLWLGYSQLMDKAVFFFVGDANPHQSEWLESVSPTDSHGRDALIF